MKNYYRFTNDENPMSRTGYAMFAENEESVSGYGDNEFLYDGTNGVLFEDLCEDIKEAIGSDPELPLGFCGGSVNINDYCDEMDITIDEFIESFNPDDIVANAGIFDSEAMVTWLWETALERKNIQAIILNDGAIVFDETLIEQIENEWLI